MNSITMTGRLTRNPEINYTPSGTIVTKFSLAEDVYDFKTKEKAPQYMNVVAFGKKAEAIGNNFEKGQQIMVSGELRMTDYVKDGQNRRYYEIHMQNFAFCGKKPTSTTPQPTTKTTAKKKAS